MRILYLDAFTQDFHRLGGKPRLLCLWCLHNFDKISSAALTHERYIPEYSFQQIMVFAMQRQAPSVTDVVFWNVRLPLESSMLLVAGACPEWHKGIISVPYLAGRTISMKLCEDSNFICGLQAAMVLVLS